ncbi:GIY-YIG nuclease family protein [Rhodoplanes serenus]|uniref:GIY-YIG nuclease family protein n=1 Tax=Rhodoplanes serenus TaxID=200615 RepID=UPI000DADD509|nr:GIY-YIG nuclease family protein [Rhodoplanes serenus]RAI37124.1 excinuclease ABC subunit C [Rhodoplanes serenus]
MTSDGFSIRIYVPDGDPHGVRIIDRMASTGLAITFPRSHWPKIKSRPEFDRTGVYILSGYTGEDSDLPTLYIGQGDGLRDRIESHFAAKEFWDWGFAFVTKSNDSGFNRAHITWLEHMLIARARRADRSHLNNGNTPSEPTLSEADKADTRLFLKEILQVLPLVGLRAFEIPVPVATPNAAMTTGAAASVPGKSLGEADTIIVPAQRDGFEAVFLGQNAWHAIRIGGGMIPKIKYVAAYQSQPVKAVTHVAPVASIEPYGEDGKYKLVFAEAARPIGPIPFADAPSGSMQGPRYTTYARLLNAKKVTDLFLK